MLAFLKRHWFLLVCTLALSGCTMVNFAIRLVHFGTRGCYIGAEVGNCGIVAGPDDFFDKVQDTSFHAPNFGRIPEALWDDEFQYIVLPIWLPLSGAIGWLSSSELRRRERLAKDTESN